jgi:hypothetical protein
MAASGDETSGDEGREPPVREEPERDTDLLNGERGGTGTGDLSATFEDVREMRFGSTLSDTLDAAD